jgi:hypothetical protein
MDRTDSPETRRDEIHGVFQLLSSRALAALATGDVSAREMARRELAARGHDLKGRWVGFRLAAEIHHHV